MSTILLTGFEPFGGHQINPSPQIADRLHSKIISAARAVGITLPGQPAWEWQVFYQALHYARQWDLHCCAGFVHLPLLSEQAKAENRMYLASLPLASMVAGVQVGIEDALQDVC